MFKSIFTKTMYEKRWTILFWSLGVIGISLLMMGFYHSFSQGGFDDALKDLPKAIQNVVGDIASLKTVPGYVSQQVFALRIPLLAQIMGIILFTGLLAGDENQGTLQTLLAQPVSRLKVFVQKLTAGLLISLLICSASFIGVIIGVALIHEHIGIMPLIESVIGVWLLTGVFGSLGFALGAITGKRGVAGSITGLVAFGSYLLTSFAPNVKSVETVEKLSPFHYYNKPSITEYGLDARNVIIMISILVALLLIAGVIFNKRDINQQ